ncbi:MAG: nucleotide pyrophosphatase [Balneolaceae bacterium]|nr:MAG: nucleotide pyrophosphatase [Balneolaceae bacterium]
MNNYSRTVVLISSILLLILSGCRIQDSLNGRIASHVIIIGLDGVGSDAMQLSHTPHLNRIISEGFIAPECRVVMPSVSSSNFKTMLTGVGPSEHGVTSNSWQRDNRLIDPVVTGYEDLFPSILSWTREQLPDANIHFFYEWGSLARMFELSAADRAEHENDGETNFRNAMNAFFEELPDLLFLNVDETDAYGHRYSWESDEFMERVSFYDALIGEFVTRLEENGLKERTLLLITADHGGINHGHGGESDEEMYVPIILFGAGVHPGKVYDETCYLYDVAPTAAYALGVTPPTAVFGRPLKAAFSAESSNRTYVPLPKIRPAAGFYTDPEVEVTLRADHEEAVIHYTIDGSQPGTNSAVYQEPFSVSGLTLIRALTQLGGEVSREQSVFIRTTDETSGRFVEWTYIEGEWRQVPDFSRYPVVKRGTSFEISLDEIPHREDYFAVAYTTHIEIETGGTYTFFTNSDDGSLLFIDGELIVDNDGTHSTRERSGTIELESGIYPLEVRYFENYMGEHLDVSIQGPGIPKQILTNRFFRPQP